MAIHSPSSRLHALLIGIDTYASEKIHNLGGAVADAKAMQGYVETRLGAPKSQIITLHNEQATREAILDAFEAMTSGNIQRDAPILIYYAGHGSTARAPKNWDTGNGEIQLIVPHDCTKDVDDQASSDNAIDAIPDRALNVLLQRLAEKKGDNITVIFDCCHSGSGTRKYGWSDPTYRERGFALKDPLPENIDEDILKLEVKDRAAHVATKFVYTGLHSHVLLAACSATEVAGEERGRGRFTRALLDVLDLTDTTNITYSDLIKCIVDIPGQNPQCEGQNSHRMLFNRGAPNLHSTTHPVHQQGDEYVMGAGAVHGITAGSEFRVYAGSQDSQVPTSQILGRLAAGPIEAFKTYMTIPPDAEPFDINQPHAFALEIRSGERKEAAFRLRIHSAEKEGELKSAFDALKKHVDQSGDLHSIRLVEGGESADVEIALENGEIVFLISDNLTTGFGLERMYQSVRPHIDDILPVLQGAAHYYWHLNRTPDKLKGSLSNQVDVEFVTLEETDEINDWLETVLAPNSDNLIVGSRIDIEADDKTIYGIKITSRARFPMYASLFYFDSSDLSITPYYHSPVSGKQADPSIPAEGSLTIGYGSGGAAPYKYFLRPGQTLDVGYLKLFLSTKPVDLSSIPQSSPFPGPREAVKYHREIVDAWDTIKIAVVQHAPGSLAQMASPSPAAGRVFVVGN
ncbi:hypothetical protein OF83DRAFT_1072600 [Amylostereum chailletii]|nr:hypothetical protein OF83DRAFT_1072600 [Amylostereum chailletii]